MDQRTNQMLFALLRSAIRGTSLTEEERNCYSPDLLEALLKISYKHDVIHLLVFGLKQNELLSQENSDIEKYILKAVYRYERIRYEYENLCAALEKAQIPFLPLKGAVLCQYYSEPWMRTSSDIDILVHRDDLDNAISYLSDNHKYVEKERATHDVSIYSPMGVHVELHFDLIEEGRAQKAIDVLQSVWENVTLHENSGYWHEMNDEYFYFYHIAHMAKHFETGGCGIRPFIDLWILDNMPNVNRSARDDLLIKGGLLKFANASRGLSKMWFGDKASDKFSLQMQNFLLDGGVYGSSDNRVAIQQKKSGGRIGYIFSRMFIPYSKLKRYYPILEKHRWLMPVMQVRRWFMLLNPNVAKMAKREMAKNVILTKSEADEMSDFLDYMGLK